VAWYRFRVTFHDCRGVYLTIVLLVGLLGGLAMGAMAGARRTQSSFPTLLARTNTSTLLTLSGVANSAIGQSNGYSPALERTIAHLPYVKVEKSVAQINLLPLNAKGQPVAAAEGYSFNGSVNGEEFTQDRIIITDGRMANARRANEFVMDSATARHFGFHLGQVVTFWAYSNAQGDKLATLTLSQVVKEVKPFLRIKVKLVGVGAISAGNLMQDAVDTGRSTVLLFTPALTDQLLRCCVNTSYSALQLSGGTAHESAVETEISRVLPKGLPSEFTELSGVTAKAEQTIKPESIALGVFGVMALLAMLVIAGQLIGRRLRSNATDVQVLRALGAEPAMTYLDGLIGIVAAVLVGSLLAGLVAIGLSPFALLGPARPYLPHGVNFDWTVLGLGLALIVLSLGLSAVLVAIRSVARRAAPWRERASPHGSRAARAAASANLPVSAVTGIRFALEPGTGRNTVPVRSAIIGTVIAVVIVTATVTFGASLQTLVAKPALYGWNFTYELNGGGGLGDIPAAGAATMLNRDPYVQAWSDIYFGTLQIDGQNVSAMGTNPRAVVGPPLLSGHAFDTPNQVVLGAATLAQLHKKLGDTVEVGAPGAATTRLKIVGTATLPTIGIEGATHLEMGSGAVLSYKLIPAHERDIYDVPSGPNAVLVRVKPGVNHAAALSSLNNILTKLDAKACCGAQVDGVERPAQIINYGALGSTPAVLGGALAAGAIVAMGLTLIASVRRRRRDLALLKTLGFTHGQLAAAIAWQSSVAVGIGTIVGVPLGIITGHLLWDLFAREINAVPQPTVPVLSVVLIVVGSLVLANVVAAIPGRIAARTSTGLLLRAE
jgi:Na+-transporting methylmalonyl-CoA/oxaloacetate decarboxylase gamma subunit